MILNYLPYNEDDLSFKKLLEYAQINKNIIKNKTSKNKLISQDAEIIKGPIFRV